MHLAAWIEGVRTHASTSVLRMSTDFFFLASKYDWRSRSLKKACWGCTHLWGRRSDWLAVSYWLYWSTVDAKFLRWEHTKRYTWWW